MISTDLDSQPLAIHNKQKNILPEQTLLLLTQTQQPLTNPKSKILSILTERKKTQSKIQSIKQIQQYRKISEHLDVMHRLKKINSQKLRKLQKNVSNLDFLRRLSFKQTLKIKNRRQKLQETQSIVEFMDRLKRSKEKQEEQKLFERKRLCSSLRESMLQSKQMSFSTHQYVKQSRLRQFKQKREQLLQNYEKNLQNLLEQNRQKAHRTRLSELRLKEKLKKYEEYKIYLGRVNYEKKLEDQFKRHAQNKRYLINIESKLKDEHNLFKKTEKLKKQTKKIESFYLTGAGTE